MFIVSVDCGRSAIKFASGMKQVGMFAAKWGKVDFNYLKSLEYLSGGSYIICSVDGGKNVYFVGETCDKFLTFDKVMHLSNDEVYISNVDFFVKVAVALSLIANKKNNDSVILGFNLTFNNNDEVIRNAIRNALIGKHRVILYNYDGSIKYDVNFSIEQVSIVYQSWSSLVYFYLNDKLEINNLFLKDGLVIDWGYKTIDVTLNRNLVTLKGVSYDYGMSYIYSMLLKELSSKYRIKLKEYELERYVYMNDVINTRSGQVIKVSDEVKRICDENFDEIYNFIMNDFNDYIVNYVILTGGGINYFYDNFKKNFNNVIIPDSSEMRFSNALGMYKFISFSLKK